MEAAGADILVVSVGFVCDACVEVVLAVCGLVHIMVAVGDVVDMFFSVGASDGLTVVVVTGFLVVDACKFVVVAEEGTAGGADTVVGLTPANDTEGGIMVVVLDGDVGVEAEEVLSVMVNKPGHQIVNALIVN